MTIITRHSVLGFISGVVFILLLEVVAALVLMSNFGLGSRDDSALPEAPALPGDMRLGNLDGRFRDLDGQEMSFADLQDKVVILNLWATWCPPCRAEMPSLENLWRMFRDEEKVAVICVSEERAEDVRAHPFTASVNMPLYVFATDAPTELNTRALPTTYIFDRRGQLVFSHTGMAQWDAPHVVMFVRDQLKGED